MFCCVSGEAQEAQSAESASPLTQFSLEELLTLEVTSVSKKTERMSQAAAAVFVITQDDIRRTGAANIPDALRMVPGVNVARLDANKWGVSVRNFNDRFAGKLLVLIDGRSVYTPLFSGVYWEFHDIPTEDIDRIEVIRGPGAALWGANAVNGVINIITKNAKDTQGGLLALTTGSEESLGSVRYGSQVGDNLFYRLYAKSLYRDESDFYRGGAADEMDVQRAGFRIDWDASDQDELMMQSAFFDGDAGSVYNTPTAAPPYFNLSHATDDMRNAFFLAHWKHTLDDSTDYSLQLYYDWMERDLLFLKEQRGTFDLDFQHRFSPFEQHEWIWGLGYRLYQDDIGSNLTARFDPSSRNDQLFSAFWQDEITLVPDRLVFTLGSKIERNDYSGFEFQPNARLAWTPTERQTLWFAVSRAVRTPARYEHDAQIQLETIAPGSPDNPLPLPLVVTPTSDRSFDSEDMAAFEVGYRTSPIDRLTIDLTAYYTLFDELLIAEPGALIFSGVPAPGHFILPLYGENNLYGEAYGFEAAIDFQLATWHRIRLAYTYADIQLHKDDNTNGFFFEGYEWRTPPHQASIRSSIDLTSNLELDLWARYVDELPNLDIPYYITLDARLGWHPSENLEVALGVQNALENRHREFTSSLVDTGYSYIERNIYGKVTWRF